MLPVGWLVLAVVVAVLLTVWITFTLTRLDRLHARVDAAQAALDAQLVRRAAALLRVAEGVETPVGGFAPAERARLEAVAQSALDRGVADQGGERGPGGEREAAENAVGREIAALAVSGTLPADNAELRESTARVLIARRFYNDAVRDTRALRAQRMPRLLHLAGHRDLPEFFDIDDTVPSAVPDTEQDPA